MTRRSSTPCSGYLTVFLALILPMLLSLTLALISGAGENLKRYMAEYVTDIAGNSVLAEYEPEVLSAYDLFFVEYGYGSESAATANMVQRFRYYAERNLTTTEKLGSAAPYAGNLARLSLDTVNLDRVGLATDDGGIVLRRQAVDAVRDMDGVSSLIDEGRSYLGRVQSYDNGSNAALDAYNSAKSSKDGLLSGYDGQQDRPSVSGYDPTAGSIGWFKGSILRLVTDSVSGRRLPYTYSKASSRSLNCGTGLNGLIGYEDNALDRLLFNEYVLAHTNCYTSKQGDSAPHDTYGQALEYETEYVIIGKPSDEQNIADIVSRLYAIRCSADLVSLMGDSARTGEAESIAAGVAFAICAVLALFTAGASIQLAKPLTSIFKTMIIALWSCAEATYDVATLLGGGKIPAVKSTDEWHTQLSDALGFSGRARADGGSESGMRYEDYLRIFLMLQDSDALIATKTLRMADLIEVNMRALGNEHFRLDTCADYLSLTVNYSSGGRNYALSRVYGY